MTLPHPNIEPPPGAQLDSAAVAAIVSQIQENFDALGFLVGGLEGRKRMISGAVESSGGVFSGVGFSVSHPSTGVYKITLDTALRSEGICAAFPQVGGVPLVLGSAGMSTFEVNTRASATELANSPFLFLIRQN